MISVYIYGAILSTMGWRAASRLQYASSTENYRESLTSQIIALVASIVFMSSDSMLAYNAFHTKIPHSHILVLFTYWYHIFETFCSLTRKRLAQFLFTFSLLREPVPFEDNTEELKKIEFI